MAGGSVTGKMAVGVGVLAMSQFVGGRVCGRGGWWCVRNEE